MGIQKNTKGILRGGQTSRLSVMTISLLFSLVLVLGFFLIQGTQLSCKAPTDAAIQDVVLRDNETSSDFGSNNEAYSDFGSLGVPWCMFLTLTAIAYCWNSDFTIVSSVFSLLSTHLNLF